MMSTLLNLLIFCMLFCDVWCMQYTHIARRWSPSLALCLSSRSVQLPASSSSTIDFYCVCMVLRCFTLEGALHGKTLWAIFGLSERESLLVSPKCGSVGK